MYGVEKDKWANRTGFPASRDLLGQGSMSMGWMWKSSGLEQRLTMLWSRDRGEGRRMRGGSR